MEFSDNTIIDCIDLDSLCQLKDMRAQAYLKEVHHTHLFDEHLFLERTFCVLDSQAILAQQYQSESKHLDQATMLYRRAKELNTLKLIKEEYFIDKMPKSSLNTIKNISDSNSTNSTCGEEDSASQKSSANQFSMAEFDPKPSFQH